MLSRHAASLRRLATAGPASLIHGRGAASPMLGCGGNGVAVHSRIMNHTAAQTLWIGSGRGAAGIAGDSEGGGRVSSAARKGRKGQRSRDLRALLQLVASSHGATLEHLQVPASFLSHVDEGLAPARRGQGAALTSRTASSPTIPLAAVVPRYGYEYSRQRQRFVLPTYVADSGVASEAARAARRVSARRGVPVLVVDGSQLSMRDHWADSEEEEEEDMGPAVIPIGVPNR